MIFIPIFKTKQNAERSAIAELKPIFSNNLIPFLQIIKNVENQNFKIMANSLEDGTFFYEVLIKDIPNYTNETIAVSRKYANSIPVFQLNKIDSDLEYSEFAKIRKNEQKPISLKIKIEEKAFAPTEKITQLQSSDYLFIDISDSDYSSLESEINEIKKICSAKIIIISQERKDDVAGKYYKTYKFNRAYFISTVLECIKSGEFNEDGFASYCTAKNNEEETGGNGQKLTGVFLTYVYKENAVYAVTSPKQEIISKVYTNIRDEIKKKSPLNDALNSLYSTTPISKNRMDKELLKTKNSRAVDFIEISIIHYVEEINNNVI